MIRILIGIKVLKNPYYQLRARNITKVEIYNINILINKIMFR